MRRGGRSASVARAVGCSPAAARRSCRAAVSAVTARRGGGGGGGGGVGRSVWPPGGPRGCSARHGYEGATVRRLEQSTGLSRGAIFHHFRDKEALFLALAEQDAETTADLVATGGVIPGTRGVAGTGP